ncbi:Uracil-DNA glycosylase [Anaerococcus prevotii]|uniref:Uracil-DNA glycosylase n=1 Tax=Anaerococcus prevotii (strain ATCC 9321 / DSM 20548 / JCM 6508 / NCTC 11806 / PC1) TaxID=525919 RepID=C7RHI9_ANAPD|nr:uracil-DNA glycosylase [Anaerococcus prevotii]ACV28950.1 uracil-DNA glycosylase [Anaerococcus prevotii DSM 20548]SUU94623.1 Uracil-DNA glycosylase [Anaerococcus prevotii]
MSVQIGNDWDQLLKEEWEKPYYKNLRKFLINEYKHYNIYPDMYDLFNALKYVSYEDTKVVILGQDPYHGRGQAHGFSFSVKEDVPIPPSLLNIYKELNNDLGLFIPDNGDLTKWAEQGVLLLNTVLTVREKSPNSHKGKGWEILTDRIIELLNKREKPMVFILWGANAKSKERLITNKNHLILKSVHPSPLSAYRGFFGSKVFSKTNEFLKANNMEEIDWQIENQR